MAELERMLSRLGEEIDWPATPDLASRVTARLDAPPATRPRGRLGALLPPAGLRRSLALAAIALLLLGGAAVAAVPGVRDAVRDLLGLQGAIIERRESLPTPPAERALDLGERTTLDGAAGRVGFTPVVPGGMGRPRVFVRQGPSGGELSLAYAARPGLPRAGSTRLGLLLSEFRADLNPQYLRKVVGASTTTERVRVDGHTGIWIEGAPHFFLYQTPDGAIVEDELRLAENVLLLERGRLLVRLEGAFGRERAIQIARSLR